MYSYGWLVMIRIFDVRSVVNTTASLVNLNFTLDGRATTIRSGQERWVKQMNYLPFSLQVGNSSNVLLAKLG